MKTNTSHNIATLTKRLWPIAVAAGLLFAGTAQAAVEEGIYYEEPSQVSQSFSVQSDIIIPLNSDPVVNSGSVELIADGGSEATEVVVGEFSWEVIDQEAGDLWLRATYQTESPWCMTATHLEVATDLDGFPLAAGNAIPGKFTYGEAPLASCETTWSTMVDLDNACSEFLIAAHADVQSELMDTGAIENYLPDQGEISVQYPYAGAPSYFQSTLSFNDPLGVPISDTYDGWCVDTDHTIAQNTLYTCNLYSSYETLPDGVVDFPDNLDLVNWIINQGYVGTTSAGCEGTSYTYGDVQRAIWTLIDDENSTSGLGSYSHCRVAEIVASALGDGEGFVPGCDGVIALLCQPVNNAQVTIAQVTLVELGTEEACIVREETAWGRGVAEDGSYFEFPGRKWDYYMEASCAAPAP